MGFFWLAYVFLWHTFTIKKIISLFSDITECSNLPDIFPDQTESTLSPETLSSFSWRNNIRSQNLGTSYVHCYSGIKGKTQKYMCVCVCVLSCIWLFLTPWTVACQIPLSVRFSQEKYWSGFQFSPPGHLSNPGIQLVSLVACKSPLAGGFFTNEPTGKTRLCVYQPYTLEFILISSNLIHYHTEWPSLLLNCNAPLRERSILLYCHPFA